MVSIDNHELSTYLQQYPDHWIGLSDTDNEGSFAWVNGNGLEFGSTFNEDPWAAGEPNVRFVFCIENIFNSFFIWKYNKHMLYLHIVYAKYSFKRILRILIMEKTVFI